MCVSLLQTGKNTSEVFVQEGGKPPSPDHHLHPERHLKLCSSLESSRPRYPARLNTHSLPAASAANAGGFLQTPLSAVPRLKIPAVLRPFCAGSLQIGS